MFLTWYAPEAMAAATASVFLFQVGILVCLPEDHREAKGSAEREPGDVHVLGGRVETETRQAVEHRVEHDARLHAGEVHAEAGVWAVRERHVLPGLAEHVAPVRVRPPRRSTVGRAETDAVARATR